MTSSLISRDLKANEATMASPLKNLKRRSSSWTS